MEIALPEAVLQPSVTGPGDRAVQARFSSGYVRFVPREPGAYTVALPGAPPLAWIAVNTPSIESDVRWYGGIGDLAREIDPTRFIRRILLSPWILWGALAALVGQAGVGWVRGRRHAD